VVACGIENLTVRPNRDLLASIAGAVGAPGAFLAVLNLLGTLIALVRLNLKILCARAVSDIR